MLIKVNEAIQIGISIMDKYFEKLENKENGDEDEEEGNEEDLVIYEAKDPYILRSLPYLIGSPLYMENDHVGLRDDFDEEEEEEVNEEIDEDEKEENINKVSDSTTDDDDDEEESEDDLFNEQQKPEQTNKNKSDDDDEDDDGDIFNTKSTVRDLFLI
jgi:WASH complex subunit FAM21